MTSLGCAACGGCCDPVHLGVSQRDTLDRWRQYVADGGEPPEPGYDLAFILAHWHEISRYDGGARYRCDRFDADTRQCTAHEDRPPVCRDFPFYDRPGDVRALGFPGDEPACSYWLDVPAADRPEGVRPLIPLTVLR